MHAYTERSELRMTRERASMMKNWKWLWGVLVALMLLEGWCDGCLEHEKIALLQLKPFFNHLQGVEEWVEWGDQEFSRITYSTSTSDCCEWERVECNSTTRRIIRLFLNQSATYYDIKKDWYLNASLFIPFEELKSLYLSWNFIAGCIYNEGFERLSLKLDKLEILDLSGNYLNDSIFSSLSELSSLKSLCLADNQFTESNHTNAGIKKLSKLNNLETLDLSYNSFGNSILSHLHGFTSLKTLYLQNCGLKGTLHMSEFSNLTNLNKLYLGPNEIESLEFFQDHKGELRLDKLKVLDLSYNLFNNSIFSSLGALSNLKSLYIGSDKLKGPLDITELNALNKLEEMFIQCSYDLYFPLEGGVETPACRLQSLALLPLLKSLHLTGFSFNGTMTTQEFHNFTYLEELSLDGSLLQTNFLRSIGEFNCLKRLSLFHCGINFGSMTPLERSNLTSLEELRVKSSSLSSNFIGDLGTLTSLKTLEVVKCGVNDNLPLHEKSNLTSSSLPSNFIGDLGTLTSLKTLEVVDCEVNDNLPLHGFCELRHLQELYIIDINLKGNLPQCFSNLTTLETLALSSNQFSGDISALKSLTSLETLDLSYNKFFGDISALKSLTSLEILDLSFNKFSGNIFALKSLTSLEILELSSNQFSGDISALKSLTSLEILDLSSNQFAGDISAIEHLTPLQQLSLSDNNFEIPSSLGPLFNLSKLRFFYADNNTIYPETEMQSLVGPTFQLEEISLSCCGNGGSFPQFLYHQHDLRSVDLSNIYFKGHQFPHWLLENNTNLYHLFLANCSLWGPFQLPFASHVALLKLDVSNNFFSSNIPIEIGAKLPSLMFLNMSKNHFNGGISSSFGDISSLESLDLSNNQLSSGIPDHLVMGCSSLQVLALSSNTMEGRLFSGNFNLTNLSELQLNGNNFSGKIPDVLSNCSGLQTLDLSNNHLFGSIPSWIWNLSSLSTLDVSKNQLFGRLPQWKGSYSNLQQISFADNHLEGPIPVEFCKLNFILQFLDLSMNNISGSLPSCFNPLQITEVHLSKNRLEGPLPTAFRDCSLLVTLDLSYNNLTGNIPSWISRLSRLSYLLLKRNHFDGDIPVQLCKLAHLSLIDLSHNNLSGGIPPCLKVTALNLLSSQYVRSFSRTEPKPGNGSVSIEEPIEYTIKSMPYSYKKRNLVYLSGIDLSCNKLSGEIPQETENFHLVFALNLSHNSLTGQIPHALSNLMQLESLDLSSNNLSGNIPSELVKLHFLAFFNVSYNNLSGKTPERIQQFGTFDESSYLGNPFLCGPPLQMICSLIEPSLTPTPRASSDGFIDMDVFYVSFIVSYVIVLLSIVAVLYINPHWRRVWFYHVEMGITSSYYFVVDNLPRRFCCGTM